MYHVMKLIIVVVTMAAFYFRKYFDKLAYKLNGFVNF